MLDRPGRPESGPQSTPKPKNPEMYVYFSVINVVFSTLMSDRPNAPRLEFISRLNSDKLI